MVLWIFGYLMMLRIAVRGRRHAKLHIDAVIAQAAFLSLIGMAIVMIFDNPMVYTFALGPIGVLVGSTIGSLRRQASIPSPLEAASEPS